MAEPTPRRLARGLFAALLVAGLVIGTTLIIRGGDLVYEHRLRDLRGAALRQLDLYTSHLEGQLRRFEALPEILAREQVLLEPLRRPADLALIDHANRRLEQVADASGALDVYLMDGDGLTIAASNWSKPRTFVGRNFAFRPYFQQALQGAQGRYFALGTTSRQRGYYFAYPMRDGGAIRGVIVVKLQVDTLEKEWRGDSSALLVTDVDGVVFIATRPQWAFRSLGVLGAERRKQIRSSKRYGDNPMRPLGEVVLAVLGPGERLVEIPGTERAPESYLMVSRAMPEAGWLVHLLMDMRGVRTEVLQARMMIGFALLVGLLLLLLGWQRQRRRRERERLEADALTRLEHRVAERTAELRKANEELSDEVQRHGQTQDELIQATKLAALGQIAAGINHELNQPLAAMRSYADNARLLLKHGRDGEVDGNLGHISELTARMAQISSQLKVFSRKSSGDLIPVSVASAVAGAQRILEPRAREERAEIIVQPIADDLSVMADLVQLEQVLVNLMGNALDAVRDGHERHVEVSAEIAGDKVRIGVADSGPGIEEGVMPHIFDPFFTTSASGLGLGLSISYRIAERLEGRLYAENVERGGARFTLELALAA